MTRKSLLMGILFLFLTGTVAFAEYDRSLVVSVMRSNVTLMGQLKSAAREGDFFAAADALMELARGSYKIKDFTPKRGSQRDWTNVHERFIKAAFRGIGACAEEDKEGLNDVIEELTALNREGHRSFR